MNTFLRVTLAGRDGTAILVNVDHIVRIHPSWPQGSTIVLNDDTSVNTAASMDEIQNQMTSTNGRIVVKTVKSDPHEIDAVYEAARADLLP